MRQIAKEFDIDYVFYADPFRCVYTVTRTAEGVMLTGKESEGEAIAYVAHLRFSEEQEPQVQSFVRFLTESKTFPRMMIELAEEYFSSAFFD